MHEVFIEAGEPLDKAALVGQLFQGLALFLHLFSVALGIFFGQLEDFARLQEGAEVFGGDDLVVAGGMDLSFVDE